MLKFSLPTSCLLGIAPDGAALLKAGGRNAPDTVLAEFTSPSAPSAQALLDGLRARLADSGTARLPVSVVLADHWVRLFMVTPPRNAASLEDCEAAALLRFQELYGEAPAQWQLRADWDARHPFLACAIPNSLLASLQQLASACRWTLLSVMPQFVAAWNRWHRELDGDAWFGVALGNRLTLGAIEHGRLRAINTMQVADSAWQDEQWLPAQLAREALRLDMAAPQALRLCGPLAGVTAVRKEIAPGCSRLDAVQAPAVSAAQALARVGRQA